MDVPALRRRLLAWYRAHRRNLPWRGRDVYGVWVSEVMLQQTRVDVVIPYYLRWMDRFPTVQALAAAPEEDVLRAWTGLGYYSRARNLHAAAKAVARDGWPTDFAAWRALPGVGPYTAAAVTSIALGHPNAAIDGNVERVVARLAAESGDVRTADTRKRIAANAQAWLAPRVAGDWNQAVMDLGATVCTPRNPRCDACPVASLCAARGAGIADALPRKARAKPPVVEERAVAVVRRAGKVLLVRPRTGLLAGMWALPGGPREEGPLDEAVHRQAGVRIQLAPGAPADAVHQFSHRTWRLQVHEGGIVGASTKSPGRPRPAPGTQARWIPIARLHEEAIPAATRVALAAVGIPAGPGAGPASTRRTPVAPAATKPKTRKPSARP